jgi:hypothetical protein
MPSFTEQIPALQGAETEQLTGPGSLRRAGSVSPQKDLTPAPLCVMIVYDLQAAYRHGLRMLVSLDRLAGGGIDVRLIPWRLDEFDQVDRRTLAIENFGAADVVLVSMTSAVAPPERLRRWLLEAVPNRNGRPALLIVALLGTQLDGMDPPESPRLQSLKQTAAEAGCDFLAPM